jgi:hypothetical protein
MSSIISGPNKIITDGLVLHLDAANSKSYIGTGTEWKDLSGRRNNGTLINGPTFNPDNGGSIVFDGVDDYVGSFNSLNLLNNITVSCWFSFINIPSGTSYRGIVGDWNTVNNTRSWLLTKFNTNNTISFFLNSTGINSNNININSTTLIIPNVKYYASAVYNGNTMSIYVNGVLENSTNYSSNIFQGTLLRLGNFSDSNFSNSNIYQTSIYNRALTQEEITQNFNAIRGRFNI